MDDALSSSSDSVSDRPSNTSTATGEIVRPFSPKPRRLARGLNDLFARQSGPVQVSATGGKPMPAFVDDSTAGPAPSATSAQDQSSEATAQTSRDDHEKTTAAATVPAPAPVPVTVDASPSPTGFEYRFVQLVSRLDATCNLFADARQTHLVAAQRNSRIAWSIAGGLAIIAGVALWMAGSKATYNKAQLDYEQARSALIEKTRDELNRQNAIISAANESLGLRQQSLSGEYATVQEQAAATRAEIETIRKALSKANEMIDELMARPEQPVTP